MSFDHRFGLSAALTTPFDAGHRIDAGRAIAHARWCLDNGCDSVTLFGTTGEGASIGTQERGDLLRAFLAAGLEPARLLAGIMANSVEDAAGQARQGLEAGCRGVLLAPPSYYKAVSDDGLFAWFSGVIEALGPAARGVILYNIPSVTAVELSVALIGRLKTAFPAAVTGVKDSSGTWSYTEKLLGAHRDLAILIGDERDLAAGVRLGSQGAISGMANVCPRRMLPMVREGRDDPALSAIVDALVKGPVTAGVKAMVAHRSGDVAWRTMRPPLAPLSDGDMQHLAGFLDRMDRTAVA